MQRHPLVIPTPFDRRLLAFALCFSLALPAPAHAALVDLATKPLAQTTSIEVKPNLLFVLDDSGSMSWTYMPDEANNFRGDSTNREYGYFSSQCNGVYYNPNITYSTPLNADGTAYAAASFTAARDNGFDSGSTARNLNSEFYANRFSPESANTTYSGYGSYTSDPIGPTGAFYYLYSGTQTDRSYGDTSSTFYQECNSDIGDSPGNAVFAKRRLASTMTTPIVVSGTNSTSITSITVNGVELLSAATSASTSSSTVASRIATNINARTGTTGYSASVSSSTVTVTGPVSAANHTPVIAKSGSMTVTTDVFPETDGAKLTNFANWYSYYRTRMLTMKSAAGRAFSTLDNKFRVGLMRINSSSTPSVGVVTFESTQRSSWYTTLYGTVPGSGTPLRKALSDAGRYFAGQTGATDPMQYSCQQNFTILSTDGYWNGAAGYQLDGSTDVGNQDGTVDRPMYDGAQAATTVTITYTRNNYGNCSTSGCSGGRQRYSTQPEIGSCAVTVTGVPTGTESCNPTNWSDNGSRSYSTCSYSCTKPSPDPSPKVEQSRVTTPGAVGGSSDSLADVAMYYYTTDLRPGNPGDPGCTVGGNDVCQNNVFIGSNDNNTQQHMTTFTLGLGANGRMRYSTSYLAGGSADYEAVKLGSTASATVCTWQAAGTVCNWPLPGSDQSENIDDMWHAAVNGRGAYFAASDPASLATGLATALGGIGARVGAAAAAATSTLNPTNGNNFAFVASYTNAKWKGNLEARQINTVTGAVDEDASWCLEDVTAGACADDPADPNDGVVSEQEGDSTTYYCKSGGGVATFCAEGVLDNGYCKVPVATACTGTLKSKVGTTADTRSIHTANSAGTALTAFDDAFATANPGYFDAARISGLSQWGALTTAQQGTAAGVNLLRFLRGQYGFEDRSTNAVNDRLYRYRETVLGDALESQPAFMAKPMFSYPYPGYSAYVTAQTNREGTVYMGTNDGMMHAIAAPNPVETPAGSGTYVLPANAGQERWAYVPSMVIPSLWILADKNYANLHRNFVNGSPTTSDICVANCSDAVTADWRTILVAGLNAGGRGYFALDITNPNSPALLWEFTTTAGIGKTKDDDLGYSYGQPVVTKKADGTWVVLVTSGYNNASPGNGHGYLYVLNAATGAIISKISTGEGTATTPSGLAKIVVWNDEVGGNQAGYVYGGDLLGNVWRFNINDSATSAEIGTGSVMKFARLLDGGGNAQPVTTTPVLGKVAGKRVVFVGTGKYLETDDLSSTGVQTQYAIKDDNATTTLVNPRSDPTMVEQELANTASGTRTATNRPVDFYTGRGWWVDFPDSKERVNIDARLVQGTLLVPSIVPEESACSPAGYGWLNFLNYATGGVVNTATNLAATKYDSPIVGINVIYVGGEPIVEVVTAAKPTPDENKSVEFKQTAATFSGKRVIWRELLP